MEIQTKIELEPCVKHIYWQQVKEFTQYMQYVSIIGSMPIYDPNEQNNGTE